MRLQGREISPTRATAMALRDEEKLIREGYEFLDEKRMLLAQEILRRLEDYQAALARRDAVRGDALDALAAATARHGLEELSVYPPPFDAPPKIAFTTVNFLGIRLLAVDMTDTPPDEERVAAPVYPSAEAERAARAFRAQLMLDGEIAAMEDNLKRLSAEYRATERRARALENVLLPETAQAIKTIDEHLEAVEQEEALTVRHVQNKS